MLCELRFFVQLFRQPCSTNWTKNPVSVWQLYICLNVLFSITSPFVSSIFPLYVRKVSLFSHNFLDALFFLMGSFGYSISSSNFHGFWNGLWIHPCTALIAWFVAQMRIQYSPNVSWNTAQIALKLLVAHTIYL